MRRMPPRHLPVALFVACLGACVAARSSAQPATADTATMPQRFIGEFSSAGGATRFTRCDTGASHAVARDGAYRDLERAYQRTRPDAGQPRLVVIDGRFEARELRGAGVQDVLHVARSVGVLSDGSCAQARRDSPVEDTPWRIVSLNGGSLQGTPGNREPRLRFDGVAGSFRATVGCNTIGGDYTLEGSALSMAFGSRTRMACPPPVADREERFLRDVLTVVEVRVTGPTAELIGPDGQSLAFLEDRPLPSLPDD